MMTTARTVKQRFDLSGGRLPKQVGLLRTDNAEYLKSTTVSFASNAGKQTKGQGTSMDCGFSAI